MATSTSLLKYVGLERFTVDPPVLEQSNSFGAGSGHAMIDRSDFEGLDWECPYCGKSVRLVPLDSAESYDRLAPDAVGAEQRFEGEDGASVKRVYSVCECPRNPCKGKIFTVLATYSDGSTRVVEAYPYPSVSATSLDPSIPRSIRDDFAEASRCFYARAYKGVVVLCRRVVQDIAVHLREKEKIDVKGRDTAEQVKELWQLGAITKDMFDTAAHIAQFGGFAAHPQEDGLDNITPALAERVLDVTNQFLQALFVMRGRNKEFNKHVQQARQKQQAS